jgi:EAL domain-containing protein (putative c-di-GMP-specific phosphodiesterase class I)
VEDLRQAIAERSLEVHFQPQIELGTGRVIGLEALVRWRHPRLGPLPPLDFLPLAEDAGLMGPLTELVLDKSLHQCARWRDDGYPVSVSVNLSTTSLLSPQLPATIAEALERHGLSADALVLEITETTAISDFVRAKAAIYELSALGLLISVDDFGAGFTSLAYLSSLDVGELKLDRSFIHGLSLSEDARDLALVRSTISLAHSLGLRVVAEGVEDAITFEMLAAMHCDLAQGYLISAPRPAAEVDLSGSAVALRSI